MMKIVLIALAVFAVAFIGMAIGVIVSNRRLKGSCGGLANMRDERGNTICEACSSPSPTCRGEPMNSEEESEPADHESALTAATCTSAEDSDKTVRADQ